MAATLKVPTTFTAEDKFSPVLKRMIKSVKRFSDKGIHYIRRFDQKVTKTFRKLGRLGRLGFGLGAGFVAREVLNVVKDYEQSLADLQAVMQATAAEQALLDKNAQKLGASTAKTATEVVGLQISFARLGFETPQIINMTEATIAGSIAMNAELSETANLVGAVVKTFDNFSSTNAPEIIDKMTLATQKSALTFKKLETGIPIVAGAANAAGVDFETMLALLGKLSDAGIDASMSSTALRNIFLRSKKAGLDYNGILDEIVKSADKLTASADIFGVRAAVPGTVLAQQISTTKVLAKLIKESSEGVAQKAADERLNTFTGSVTLLNSAWEALLIKQNDNSGALGAFSQVVLFAKRNIEVLVGIVGALIALFITMKTLIFLTTTAITLYNVGMGVMGAITGRAAVAIGANTVALGAYKTALGIATAANWLFNLSNPVGWIIILVSLIAIAINKYDEWGAALLQFIGPLGWVINLFMSFHRHWDKISEAFKSEGILGSLKMIGKIILDSILMPMQQVLNILSNLPLVGDMFSGASSFIDGIRDDLDLQVSTETLKERHGAPVNGNVLVTVADRGGNVESVKADGSQGFGILLTQTQGAF